MKIAVIGSRGFNDYTHLCEILDNIEISQIISGGARGADSLARRYANDHKIELVEFLPDYKQFGKKAPLIRNIKIVDASDIVVAFWDGKSPGTAHSIRYAESKKRVFIFNF